MDQEILDTINKRLAEQEKIHTRYQGPPGKQGKDAPPPRIVIGTVSSGEQADAKIRKTDGTFFLYLSISLAVPMGAMDSPISPVPLVPLAVMGAMASMAALLLVR